jgi:hypothetical protein
MTVESVKRIVLLSREARAECFEIFSSFHEAITLGSALR